MFKEIYAEEPAMRTQPRPEDDCGSRGVIERIKVDTLRIAELDVYARLSEVQLKRCYEPQPGLFIAESMKVIRRAFDAGYEAVSFLAEERQYEPLCDMIAEVMCQDDGGIDGAGGPVYTASFETMKELTGCHLTGGVLAAMRRRELPDAEDIIGAAQRIAVLEHVVNPTNLGAIVRSAAALGMDAVLFTPDCCDPLYRRAVRVSMGTVFQIPWTICGHDPEDWYQNGIRRLREKGFHTAAMALRDDTRPVGDPVLTGADRLAVILGTEGEGLAESTIRQCDDTVMIPMMHGVDSLNVSAAAAVAFWELGRKRQ